MLVIKLLHIICIDEFQQIAEFKDSKTFQKRLRSVWQLQKYRLGSSANVSIVKRALVKKELIEIEKRQTIIPDPIMAVWLKRELGSNL